MRISRRKARVIKQDIGRAKRSRSKFLALIGAIIIITSYLFTTQPTLTIGLILGILLIIIGLSKKTDMNRIRSSLKRHKVKLNKREMNKLR